MATPALTDPPITLTEGAARKIRQLATKEGRADALLRLRVVAGGCSGFSYELSFDDDADADDAVVDGVDGVRVVIDPKSVPIVAGSTLEFDASLMGGGLRVRNPQAIHECACGDSFSI
jgi:iron-sulfur cluster assembly accessory protein